MHIRYKAQECVSGILSATKYHDKRTARHRSPKFKVEIVCLAFLLTGEALTNIMTCDSERIWPHGSAWAQSIVRTIQGERERGDLRSVVEAILQHLS